MAEQYLQAWVVETDVLTNVIGSSDLDLVSRACRTRLADDFRAELEDEDEEEDEGVDTLEQALEALVDGPEVTQASWHNRRFMKLFAEALGTRVDNEPTLPGRGWQRLAPAFARWNIVWLDGQQ